MRPPSEVFVWTQPRLLLKMVDIIPMSLRGNSEAHINREFMSRTVTARLSCRKVKHESNVKFKQKLAFAYILLVAPPYSPDRPPRKVKGLY